MIGTESLKRFCVSRYSAASARNEELQKTHAARSGELEGARSRREKLLSEVRGSALKQEAVSLYEQLSELETRRETLERDLREHRTPAEEREHLLSQVRSDNQEIALLERQQQEANARIEQLQDQLRNIEQEADEALQLGSYDHFACASVHQLNAILLEDAMQFSVSAADVLFASLLSERNEQLKELRKKEAAMAEFMAEFESSRKRERERIDSLQASIPTLLESASRSLAVLQQHGRKGEPRALLPLLSLLSTPLLSTPLDSITLHFLNCQ